MPNIDKDRSVAVTTLEQGLVYLEELRFPFPVTLHGSFVVGSSSEAVVVKTKEEFSTALQVELQRSPVGNVLICWK